MYHPRADLLWSGRTPVPHKKHFSHIFITLRLAIFKSVTVLHGILHVTFYSMKSAVSNPIMDSYGLQSPVSSNG